MRSKLRPLLPAFLLLLLSLLAACSDSDGVGSPTIVGPAFVFFYTDD